MTKNLYTYFLFTLFILIFLGCSSDKNYIDGMIEVGCVENNFWRNEKKYILDKDESITIDIVTGKLWVIKHKKETLMFTEFKDKNNVISITADEGNPCYRYDDFMYDNLYIAPDMSKEGISYVIFDIVKKDTFLISNDEIKNAYICGFVEDEIFVYSLDDNFIYSINIYTEETKRLSVKLKNPGICAETKSVIGLDEENNISVFFNGELKTYHINGLEYKSRNYTPIGHLYYYTGDYIYFAKKDLFASIRYWYALFMPGLGPTKWYRYNINTGKKEKTKLPPSSKFIGLIDE